jgi:hypothetical protein
MYRRDLCATRIRQLSEKREFEKRRKSRCRQGGKPFHLTQVELEMKRKLEDGRGVVNSGVMASDSKLMARRVKSKTFTKRHAQKL